MKNNLTKSDIFVMEYDNKKYLLTVLYDNRGTPINWRAEDEIGNTINRKDPIGCIIQAFLDQANKN